MRPVRSFSIGSRSTRTITTRAQFNPVHDFGTLPPTLSAKDVTMKAFTAMTSNPGPLTFTFSKDYMDWYHKAFLQKLNISNSTTLMDGDKRKTSLPSSSVGSPSSSSAVPLDAATQRKRGYLLRPLHSFYRRHGEAMRQDAQKKITTAATQHGMYDMLYERQPHFPNIHINRCTDWHVREVFKKNFLEGAVSSDELWDKALMYRALLLIKGRYYPPSFEYIQESVRNVVFSMPPPVSTANNTPQQQQAPAEDAHKYPSQAAAEYFSFLVEKYHVENAIEAHVVLKCHRDAYATTLLVTQPTPPREDVVVKVLPLDVPYPPLSALLEVDGNLPLLRCLIFAEFNCCVSQNPFEKYPSAQGFVTRPTNEEVTTKVFHQGLSNAIKAKREKLDLLDHNDITKATLDGRGKDILRFHSTHGRQDSKFMSSSDYTSNAEKQPGSYVGDSSVYNPKMVRAESRDVVSRSLFNALRSYQTSKVFMYRPAFDANTMLLPRTREEDDYPPFLPTVAHFLRLIVSDKHVSFLLSATKTFEESQEIREAASDLAEQLNKMSLEFHVEHSRRVHKQKVGIAASILDSLVVDQWKVYAPKLHVVSPNSDCNELLKKGEEGEGRGSCSGVHSVANMGTYQPFAARSLDNLGFPSHARGDDYARWMRPPTALEKK